MIEGSPRKYVNAFVEAYSGGGGKKLLVNSATSQLVGASAAVVNCEQVSSSLLIENDSHEEVRLHALSIMQVTTKSIYILSVSL